MPEKQVELPVGTTVYIHLISTADVDERRKRVFLSLCGSIDDPTFVEPEDLPERDVPSFDF